MTSVFGVRISRKFVETQILRPSPYFQGQYMTIRSSANQTVLFDDTGQGLETDDGFSQHVKVKIVSEELAYNKNYKPYKILITDRPFDPSFQSTKTLADAQYDSVCSPKVSFLECKKFLQSFAEYSLVLRELDDSIKLFNNNYMVLKDYLDDAANRLEKTVNHAVEKCLKCTKMKYHSDVKFRETLSGAVESYVLGSVHNKVFPVICDRFRLEDDGLLSKCRRLNGVLPETLGVKKEFSCALPSAVVELARIDALCTPYEKLMCVKAAIDSVTEGVNAHVLKNQQPLLHVHGRKDHLCLTSDDLILLLVTVIAQAKCLHLKSDLFYIEVFSWFSMAKDIDSLSYCLVTYKAAVEYMRSTDFESVQTQSVNERDGVGIDEVITATVSLSVNNHGGDDSRPTRKSPTTSRWDRQLERISHMLDESTRELDRSRKTPTQPRSIFQTNSTPCPHTSDNIQDPGKKQNELGEFLSALQDDDFDMPFGKQT
ncbi:ankyrin repeat domain-containing protein 27-like isoform X3 [Gigantopelta aegis]|uniref:ankyrin repeat domain-containing protein 27-like isoform X3 n=2 Tax=Gigantopelta aegis TaxID=1735272 RepID=UPI001B887563|nr:ankyrin repeat domain-containing protein 27-like isoform X3 [Gigantopelta aegis]XP_041358472.1 ankyrin repeat domain-containing protein 27-like isoform X3 [Gigantopelta aegis]XP_041358481.1 ankyrin repeat domain-containing protein 27-like isoform X3 [Gigantopelta aegis]